MSLPSLVPNAYLELFLRGYTDGIMKLIIYLHLVPRLRMHGATSPLLHLFYCVLPNWTQEKFIFSAGGSTFDYLYIQQITMFLSKEIIILSAICPPICASTSLGHQSLSPSPLSYYINHYSYLHLLTYTPTCPSINKSCKASPHISIRCSIQFFSYPTIHPHTFLLFRSPHCIHSYIDPSITKVFRMRSGLIRLEILPNTRLFKDINENSGAVFFKRFFVIISVTGRS
jgi:hypothetical protein